MSRAEETEEEKFFYERVIPLTAELNGEQIDEIIRLLLEYRINGGGNSSLRACVADSMFFGGLTRDNPLISKKTIPTRRTAKPIRGAQQSEASKNFDADKAYGLRVKRITRTLAGKDSEHVARPAAPRGVDEPISAETGSPIVFF